MYSKMSDLVWLIVSVIFKKMEFHDIIWSIWKAGKADIWHTPIIICHSIWSFFTNFCGLKLKKDTKYYKYNLIKGFMKEFYHIVMYNRWFWSFWHGLRFLTVSDVRNRYLPGFLTVSDMSCQKQVSDVRNPTLSRMKWMKNIILSCAFSFSLLKNINVLWWPKMSCVCCENTGHIVLCCTKLFAHTA